MKSEFEELQENIFNILDKGTKEEIIKLKSLLEYYLNIINKNGI